MNIDYLYDSDEDVTLYPSFTAKSNNSPKKKDVKKFSKFLKNKRSKPPKRLFLKDIPDDDSWFFDEPEPEIEEEKCPNPLCDCKDFASESEQKLFDRTKKPIPINNIQDLINLGKTYHCKKNKVYFGIDLKLLCKLVDPLEDLMGLVGMKSVKENIINQIVFFLQGFNKSDGDTLRKIPNNDMMHTVITGPPGVGKTELGKILGKVYKAMGILSTGTMKVVGRADLVGKYLGHTAAKTQNVIDECKGGVLFIDEAYALGNAEGRDSFSKECIDTLNQNLTERRDFLCIIAGYKNALDTCFFAYNEGLRRRFTFRYDIEAYTATELKDIFLMKVKKEGWGVDNNNHIRLTKFFKDNIKYFPHFGGDIESLFLNCKIYHGRRVLFLNSDHKKILTLVDIEKGFEKFISNRKYKKEDNKNAPWRSMYI
jgi:hypothetical protein